MAAAFAWSYSVLDMYRTCPKKYYHIKVAKDAKDEDSSFSKEGKQIHEAAFHRVIHGTPLPLPLRHLEKVLGPYALLPGEKHGELQFALDKQLTPVAWFDKAAWVRAIIDFLVINGDRALLIDWKTGKPKDGFDQLKLSAAVLSRQMPELKKFTCAYVWVNHSHVKPYSFTMEKKHMAAVWSDNYEEVKEIMEALKTTTFPASEGPLCQWCPVRQCPHNKKK